MSDDVIKKFGLRKEYDMEGKYYENVVKEWQANSSIEIQDEGTLAVSVYDKDPQRAANIAKLYG